MTNVTDAVTATAITTDLWLLLFLSACKFDPESGAGGPSKFESPLIGGKNGFFGDGAGGVEPGSGEVEGADAGAGLRIGDSTAGAGAGAPARILLGRKSL